MDNAFLNMKSVLSAISKALTKAASQILFIQDPIAAVVASEAIDLGADMLKGCSLLERDDIHKKIHVWCKNIIPSKNEEYYEVICAATEICLEDLNLLDEGFHDADVAKRLSTRYIQRYQAQFSDADISCLEYALPAVLEKIILELMLQSEQDAEFQIAWKALILQRMDCLEREQLSQREQLADHERWIAGQEYPIWNKLSTVAELSEDYRRKWDTPLFLDDKITLKQIYQLPYCKEILTGSEDMTEGEDGFTDIADANNMDMQLENILYPSNTTSSGMLVILGHPGSGKSTLITYLLNNYDIPKNQTVRVHRFTSFENVNWNGNPENLPQLLLNALGLNIDRLQNLLLILDGLDEIDMLEGHDTFLDCLYRQWLMRRTTFRFSLIITCRTNRIPEPNILMADYAVLAPLTSEQIQQFAQTYWKETDVPADFKMLSFFRRLKNHEHNLRNILGIPLILYLTLALGITVTSGVSLSDVYDQIFSLDDANSIYFRSKYDQMHPVTAEEAEKIHKFSKQIAEKIWEFNPTEAAIEKSVYEPLATKIAGRGKGRLRKLLIGQYFMEGQHSAQLLFVHRSLYEYFTALSIFDNIKALANAKQSPKQLYVQLESNGTSPVLTALANLIGVRCLSEYPDIQNHLFNMLQRSPLQNVIWWQNLFSLFTQRGLSDAATRRPKGGIIGIGEELNRFYNLIWLVREELKILGCTVPIHLGNDEDTPIYFHIPLDGIKDLSGLYLNKIDLSGGNFEGGNFSSSNMNEARLLGTILCSAQLVKTQLRSAVMCYADLSNADLREADLSEADLQGADLSGTDLRYADLSGANLRGANFENSNLHHANLTGAVLEGANLSGTVLAYTDLSNVSLQGAILRNVDFSCAELYGTDLAYADMTDSKLWGAKLTKAKLSHAKLDRIDMQKAVIHATDMQYVSLIDAFLHSASLTNTNLQYADLNCADLRNACLLHVNLRKADLSNTYFQSTSLCCVDLREAEMIYADFSGATIEKTNMTLGSADNILFFNPDWEITWDEPIQLKTDLLRYTEETEPPVWNLEMMLFD